MLSRSALLPKRLYEQVWLSVQMHVAYEMSKDESEQTIGFVSILKSVLTFKA